MTSDLPLLRHAAILVAAISVVACSPTESTDRCDAVWDGVPVAVATIPDPADRPRIVLEDIWRAGGSDVGQELAFPALFAVVERDGHRLRRRPLRSRRPSEVPAATHRASHPLRQVDLEVSVEIVGHRPLGCEGPSEASMI